MPEFKCHCIWAIDVYAITAPYHLQCIVSKIIPLYRVFFMALQKYPFSWFCCHVHKFWVLTRLAVCASPWRKKKKTSFPCFVLKYDIHLWMQVPTPPSPPPPGVDFKWNSLLVLEMGFLIWWFPKWILFIYIRE